MRIQLTIAIIFLSFFSFAQVKSPVATNQLQNQLSQSKPGLQQVRLLTKLAQRFRKKSPQIAFRYAMRNLLLTDSLHLQVKKAQTYCLLGNLLLSWKEPAKALIYYERSLKTATQTSSSRKIGKAFYGIGSTEAFA